VNVKVNVSVSTSTLAFIHVQVHVHEKQVISSHQEKSSNDHILFHFPWFYPYGLGISAMGEGEPASGRAGADSFGVRPAADLV
jgi:hypothetical protein